MSSLRRRAVQRSAVAGVETGQIFRLGFRDRGRLIDSPEHPLFKKWAARDSD